ncbi:MAG: 23S rRNA (cytidine(2498)-2'-O)-methyltransferase RlmM [Burkholderiales bacterium]
MRAGVLVAYCRAGFEAEAAVDLERIAAVARVPIAISTVARSAFVVARLDRGSPDAWLRAIRTAPPIFARSVFVGDGPIALVSAATGRGPADRVTPLLAALGDEASRWRTVWLEYPDTNEGKALSALAAALASRVEGALRTQGRLDPAAPLRLHAFLPAGDHAYAGISDAGIHDWPLGIARVRMPAGAPSRSARKLVEALATMLDGRDADLVRPGMRAVDLGAAPGGWTFVLAQRGLNVTAIDNGSLKGRVVDDPQVAHLREDGLAWRPRRPVDWLFCDIVLQPVRIAELAARWIADGAARRAIFNLKLPMKKRYDEVQRCEQRIAEITARAGVRYTLRVKQLYHDREEVTAYLARAD